MQRSSRKPSHFGLNKHKVNQFFDHKDAKTISLPSPSSSLERQKGRLSYADRQALPKKDFAEPSKRKYPIENKAHARNALARVSQYGTTKEKRQVRAAVHKKYPEIGAKKKDTNLKHQYPEDRTDQKREHEEY